MYKVLDGVSLGIQSFCFRTYKTNEGVIDALKACGLDTIELCKKHIDVNNSTQVDNVLRLYSKEGITISSYGIDRFTNDEQQVRNIFEFAKKAGINALGADPNPDAYDMLESLCREYSVKLAVHNHGRKHRYGTMQQLHEMLDKTSEYFGVCLDTAWALDAGVDPVEAVRKIGSRIYGIHFKDFTFDQNGEHEEAILGHGNLKVKELYQALKDIGFNGYASIEYEGDVDNPIPSTKKCIEEFVNMIKY